MKKVSVIIPVYNADSTVEESIKSALNQTYNNIPIDTNKDKSNTTLRMIRKYIR